MDYLEKYYDPYEIPSYHQGGIKDEATMEDYEAFQRASLSLFLKYPEYFIENRNRMFLRMFNFAGHGFMYSDDLRFPDEKFVQLAAQEGAPERPAKLSIIQRAHFYLMEIMANDLPLLLKLLLVSGLLPISFLIFSCFRARTAPLVALIALNLVLRLVMTYLLSPAGSFKYVTSIWLGGWLLGWLYIDQKFLAEGRGSSSVNA
jgi:hypothetical protein